MTYLPFVCRLLQFMMSESIGTIRSQSGNLDKKSCKAWADHEIYNVFKNSSKFNLYNEKVPHLVKLVHDCFSVASSNEREDVFIDFLQSGYFDNLCSKEKQEEIRTNVKIFFAAIPDKDSKSLWCTRVLREAITKKNEDIVFIF